MIVRFAIVPGIGIVPRLGFDGGAEEGFGLGELAAAQEQQPERVIGAQVTGVAAQGLTVIAFRLASRVAVFLEVQAGEIESFIICYFGGSGIGCAGCGMASASASAPGCRRQEPHPPRPRPPSTTRGACSSSGAARSSRTARRDLGPDAPFVTSGPLPKNCKPHELCLEVLGAEGGSCRLQPGAEAAEAIPQPAHPIPTRQSSR